MNSQLTTLLTFLETCPEASYAPRPMQMITPNRSATMYRHEPTVIQHRQSEMTHRSSSSADYSTSQPFSRRPMLALLIAAHNEEMVLENTIRSAMRAGMQRRHIYVVDDNSADATSEIAARVIGAANVIKVGRSGKGLALSKASRHFQLTRRYQWIHIADADGGFSPDYFTVFRTSLSVKYAAATGYIKSLPGGPVSQYRVFEYTIGLDIHRRFQALTHTVTVIPGPTSCFRADVFAKVDFANHSLTEDFDVTIQIHRQKLGKIQFIPKAIAYTQDPRTVSDFVKQITRWNRGVMQGMKRHGIGRHFNRLDAYLSYQVMQNLTFFLAYCVLMPILAITQASLAVIAITFLYDVVITAVMAVLVAARARRWDILAAFPHIYILRWVSIAVFLRAFVEVVFLGRFKNTTGTWSTVERYKQPVAA